jgi:hypothetical protein
MPKAERRAAYEAADERCDRTRGQRAAQALAGTPVGTHGRLVAAAAQAGSAHGRGNPGEEEPCAGPGKPLVGVFAEGFVDDAEKKRCRAPDDKPGADAPAQVLLPGRLVRVLAGPRR